MRAALNRFLEMSAEYLVDSRTGIIRSISEFPRPAGSPALFHFIATGARGPSGEAVHSGGASLDRPTALAKAIGEVIERHCAGVFDPEALPLSTFDRADFPCLPPAALALYTPEQCRQPDFPFVPFDNGTLVRWTPAVDAGTGQTCHVPAAKVFIPYRYERAIGEHPIAQTITTGLASHGGRAEATLNAICEVIERDAFTITWQARLAMPHIRIESLGARNRDLVDRFTRCWDQLHLLDLTLDHGIPTVLCVLRTQAPGPALVFAAATELDPELAVTRCLEELELMRGFAGWISRTRPRLPPTPLHQTVRSREDHVNLYCDAANAPLADFLFASSHWRDLDEIPNRATGDPVRDLELVVARIQAVGERILVADLTTPDVAALGLHVARAIVPGFHPLVFGHAIRSLGGTRLWTVPRALGHEGITPTGGDNPAPHPFP
jgi:ribosomal protein S12 methylthiotransferase accessory factor